MLNIKIKLKTDFIDFYDHWFDNEGIVFERMTKNNLSRSEMFHLFKEKQISTPLNGKIRDISKQLKPSDWVVIYLDEYEHQGKEKLLLKLSEAIEQYPNHYASQYIKSYRATSWRELFLGDYYFLLKYTSNDLWRSNVGEVDIEVENKSILSKSTRTFDFPIYAIDYVADYNYRKNELNFFAIDLNTSPMARGTGVENLILAKDVANSIKQYIF